MRWTLTCRDAGDGSGDVILDLPDDLLQAADWDEGDTLEQEPDPADSRIIRLKKVVLCDVCDARTAETGYGVLQAQWLDGEAVEVLLRLCDGHAQGGEAGEAPIRWRRSGATGRELSMKLSAMHNMLAAGATPLSGSELSTDDAIRLAETEFPNKPWCLVRDWVIYGIPEESFTAYAGRGLQPTMVYADCIVRDEQHRWDVGQWVRSSPLKSFTHGCLFETENTVYVLLGDGSRTGILGRS